MLPTLGRVAAKATRASRVCCAWVVGERGGGGTWGGRLVPVAVVGVVAVGAVVVEVVAPAVLVLEEREGGRVIAVSEVGDWDVDGLVGCGEVECVVDGDERRFGGACGGGEGSDIVKDNEGLNRYQVSRIRDKIRDSRNNTSASSSGAKKVSKPQLDQYQHNHQVNNLSPKPHMTAKKPCTPSGSQYPPARSA